MTGIDRVFAVEVLHDLDMTNDASNPPERMDVADGVWRYDSERIYS